VGIERAVKVMCDLYKGQTCYIVGKGTSLQFLDKSYFQEPGCVIVMNDAILHVQDLELSQTIYSMQKDGYDWVMIRPKDNIILILQEQYSINWFEEHPNRLSINPVEDFDFLVTEMSVRMCVALAKATGCNKIVMLCCDSLVSEDYCAWDTRDKKVITRNDYFYKYVKPLVLEDLESIQHEIITPKESHGDQ
jgi:hypothetical protein